MAYINGTLYNDTLAGTTKDDVILGNDGNDILAGRAGNDSFFEVNNIVYISNYRGTNGIDVMYGGYGNDKYLVDNKGDKVIEYKNQGIDSVYSTITYQLPKNIENGYLILGDQKNLYGNDLNNNLNGNCNINYIYGGNGNDTINGGGYGRDSLIGGAGNDIIQASVDNNNLCGSCGNDTLIGWKGNDTLCGGKGNDVYKGTLYTNNSGYANIGNDIIRDYIDNNGHYAGNNASHEHNVLDLSYLSLSNLSLKAIDTDYDYKFDALLIKSKYGSIEIDKYFDDSSRYIKYSHPGIGEINDICINESLHMDFYDIQGMLS